MHSQEVHLGRGRQTHNRRGPRAFRAASGRATAWNCVRGSRETKSEKAKQVNTESATGHQTLISLNTERLWREMRVHENSGGSGTDVAPCSVAPSPCSGSEHGQRPGLSAPRRVTGGPPLGAGSSPPMAAFPQVLSSAHCAGLPVPYPGRSSHPQVPSLGGSPRPTLCTDSQMSLPLDSLSCMSFPGCPSRASGSLPLGTPPLDVVRSAFCPSLPSVCLYLWETTIAAHPPSPLPGALSLGDTPTHTASPAKRAHP